VGLTLLRYSSLGVVLVVLVHSRWGIWWGGVCYGPRLLADLLPVLCLALYPVAGRVLTHRGWRVVAAGLAAWSFAAHLIGVYWDDGRWNAYVMPAGLWNWTDNPLTNPPRELWNRVVINLRGLPTSGTHPEWLARSFLPDESSPAASGRTREQVFVTVSTLNVGKAVWIAWPKRARSSVRLTWELTSSDVDDFAMKGTIALRHDVFPGGNYRFQIPLVLPDRPGEYRLRVDLAANRQGVFPDSRASPHVIPVHVRPR
jgi:hypothetical protein